MLVEVNAKGFASPKFDQTPSETAEPQLWPLQIGEDPDRPPGIALDLADLGESGAVLLVSGGSVMTSDPYRYLMRVNKG